MGKHFLYSHEGVILFFFSISSFSNPVPLYSPPLPCPFSTTGLFTKAIMESGVSLSPWAISLPNTEPEPRRQAMELASRLGCGVADSTHMLACLKTKDPRDIVEATVCHHSFTHTHSSPHPTERERKRERGRERIICQCVCIYKLK